MSLGTTFYRNAAIVLLCLNLALLAFLFLMPPPPPDGQHPDGKNVKRHLNLDEQQLEQFKQYAQQHKAKMMTYNQQQKEVLEQYFAPLSKPTTQVNADSLLTLIKDLEQQKIQSTYQHFEEIKAMLREKQKTGFEEFVNKALSRILQKNKKRRK